MPATYEPIATYTAPSAQASYTFSSIPSTYTDLVLIANALTASADAVGIDLFINGGTATGRSYTRIQGNGTSATSLNGTTSAGIGVMGNSEGANLIVNIMNYSNSTTFKTILSRYNNMDSGDARVGAYVSLSQSTSAVTSLTISPLSINWAAGSTFTLYGIKAA